MRRLAAVACALLVLSLTACQSTPDDELGEVKAGGLTVKVDGVTITIPKGAVPDGTKVTGSVVAKAAPKKVDGFEHYTVAGKGLELKFEDGLQPKKPLTVSFPVDDTDSNTGYALLLDGDAPPELVPARVDADKGVITAQVPHLSFFWPIKIDLAAIVGGAMDFVLQATGIEYDKPECADQTATVDGDTYSVIQPAQGWVCVEDSSGRLMVTVSANSPVPFEAVSSVVPTSKQNISEFSAATLLLSSISNVVTGAGNESGLSAPGVTTKFVYDESPGTFTIDYTQRPDLLLGSILLKTIDAVVGGLDITKYKVIEKADCIAAVFQTSAGETLTPATSASLVRGFFACVEPLLGDLPGPQRIVLALLSGVPQVFVGSVLGAVNELTGDARFSVEIARDGTPPAADPNVDLSEFVGSWSGPIEQSSSSYTGKLDLRLLDDGIIGGTARYPELDNCQGTLTQESFINGVLTLTERIQGTNRCVQEVTVTLTLSGGQLAYDAYGGRATGTLTRK